MNRRSSVLLLLVAVAVLALAWSAPKAWRKFETARYESRIAAAARPGDIEMLSSTTCSDCVQARRVLEALHVPYSECFVELDAACAGRFKTLRALGTPTFVVRGERQTGLDRKRLALALEAPRGPARP